MPKATKAPRRPLKHRDDAEPERVTLTWLAKRYGKSVPVVSRQMKRHGVKSGPDKLVDRKQAVHAMAVGAEMDKNRAKGEAEKIVKDAGGEEHLTVTEKYKLAQLRKVIVQCEVLEVERDKIRGELMPVSEHLRILKQSAMIYNTMLEAMIDRIAAKRKDADLMREMQSTADEVARQVVELME